MAHVYEPKRIELTPDIIEKEKIDDMLLLNILDIIALQAGDGLIFYDGQFKHLLVYQTKKDQ